MYKYMYIYIEFGVYRSNVTNIESCKAQFLENYSLDDLNLRYTLHIIECIKLKDPNIFVISAFQRSHTAFTMIIIFFFFIFLFICLNLSFQNRRQIE